MDRFAAAIDNFALDVETLADSFTKAIAIYEYPYKDGAGTDDLGQKARSLRLRCYWWEETYQDHFDFLEHLKQRSLFELRHPKYGVLNGRIRSVSVRHDDRQELAEVDIDFVQDLGSQEKAVIYKDVRAASEENYQSGIDEQQDLVTEMIRNKLGAHAQAVLETDLDPDKAVAGQFPAAPLKVRTYLKTIDSYLNTLADTSTAVSNPTNSLLATVNFGINLPGRIVGTLSRACERDSVSLESLRSAPTRLINSLRTSIDTLVAANTNFAAQTRIAGARQLAFDAAALYTEDEDARQVLRRSEQQQAFDALGNYSPVEKANPVMSVRDLERSLSEVRAQIQLAVSGNRSTDSLKQMARDLLEHVEQVKLEREKIIAIDLDNPVPLHLVCLMRGLPYTYAERLLVINNIPNPCFTLGEVNVYV